LVAFDLEEGLAAFFHDGARVRPLAVQRIGGDELVIQRRQFLQQRGGGGLSAARGVFFLVVHGHGLRGPVLVLGQREQTQRVCMKES
jgi:hypothetical protein